MVRFISPLGGEMFNNGDMLAISWSSSDNVAVTSQDLALSTDGGQTFPLTVANGLNGAAQSFSFSIPNDIQTTQARLRLIVKDAAGNMAQAITAADFQIQPAAPPPDTQAPVVSISSPASGAILPAGQAIVVNWQSTDNIAVTSQALLLSTDAGTSFQTIMTFAGGIGTFTLNNTTLVNANARVQVKITATDAAGNKGEQASSFMVAPNIAQASFTKPTLTITGVGFNSTNPQATTKVLVNGKEIPASRVVINGNTTITIQGNKKKLGLIKGNNNVQVIIDNVASNSAPFPF
jgi:hypothetical protein